MSALFLLLDLHSRGFRLEARGDRLHVDAPAGTLTTELREALARAKPELLKLLAGDRKAAFAAWESDVREVADLWDAWAARCRTGGVEPPDFDDTAFTDAIGDAIKTGDLPATIEAVGRWRAAWVQVFESPPLPAGSEEKVPEAPATPSSSSPEPPPSLLAAAAQLPATDLSKWLDGEDALRREAARREFHVRADLLLDEAEGRRPPPNPTVHDMFREAQERFGTRALGEKSLTSWVRRNAPEVAARWPEAPLDASWLDWRRHVGPEAMAVLDQAWSAVLGRAAPWKNDEEKGTP